MGTRTHRNHENSIFDLFRICPSAGAVCVCLLSLTIVIPATVAADAPRPSPLGSNPLIDGRLNPPLGSPTALPDQPGFSFSIDELFFPPGVSHVVIVDIDALRRSLFYSMLSRNALPNIRRITGRVTYSAGQFEEGEAAFFDSVGVNRCESEFPAVTFPNHATIFTGVHAKTHGIVGNEFFDRFGVTSGRGPRYYAFTAGQTLALDDVVSVYDLPASEPGGLANRLLRVSTVYENAALLGLRSAVVHSQYSSRDHAFIPEIDWLTPEVLVLLEFGIEEFFNTGLGPFDTAMVNRAIQYLQGGNRPDILTLYFFGLDQTGHIQGIAAQELYLRTVIDVQLGRLFFGDDHFPGLDKLQGWNFEETVFIFTGDHGMVEVRSEDQFVVSVAEQQNSFEGINQEYQTLLESRGYTVFGFPEIESESDIVVGQNEGMSHIYVRRGARDPTNWESWSDRPDFTSDILPVANILRRANLGLPQPGEMENAFDLILARDPSGPKGWESAHQVLQEDGTLADVGDLLGQDPLNQYVNPAARLDNLRSMFSGDIFVIANWDEGYHLGVGASGDHGSMRPEDSQVPLIIARPGNRTGALAGRTISRASLADVTPTVGALLRFPTPQAEGTSLVNPIRPCFTTALQMSSGRQINVPRLRRIRDGIAHKGLGIGLMRCYYRQ